MTQAIASYPQFAVNLVSHALNCSTIVRLFDDALADLLCLQTYRHGTSPGCAYSILWTGGQPRLGGLPGHGESAHKLYHNAPIAKNDWDCRGKFFVTRDEPATDCCACPAAICDMQNTFSSFDYAIVATKNECEIANHCGPASSCLGEVASVFFNPAVKFRFTPEEAMAQAFRDDTTKSMGATVTAQPITPDHIGLYGTLSHGLNSEICQRISDNPALFLHGLFKLAWAVTLTALVVFGMMASPVIAALASAFLLLQIVRCVSSLALTLFSGCGHVPQLEELA